MLNWPVIKTEETEALQAYFVFLNGCLSAMNSVQYMEELNYPTNMKASLSKLPYKMVRSSEALILHRQEGLAHHSQVRSFIRTEDPRVDLLGLQPL